MNMEVHIAFQCVFDKMISKFTFHFIFKNQIFLVIAESVSHTYMYKNKYWYIYYVYTSRLFYPDQSCCLFHLQV